MSLTPEWRNRIENWKQELPRHFYRPLGELTLVGFVTKEHLTFAEAVKKDFQPFPAGTKWGGKWEYGWFKGEIELPAKATDKRIALQIDVGAESAIFVNGVSVGAKDRFHNEITLTNNGQSGQRYEIIIEGYAGHGPRVTSGGPIPPERESVPEPDSTQAEIGKSSFGIWDEDFYQLWIDVETLFQIRENIDPDSLRVEEIDQGLKQFTRIVDFELSYPERLKTVQECREILQPLLECKNGSTTPLMYAFGHSHIDMAWLWPLAETEHKALRTFSTQLSLIEEYPEFKFLQSQPQLYQMVKDKYPELYQRIKKAIETGQFMPDGAMWVEPDTNITGGESLIRQFIYGKRYFQEEFGIDSKICWLPDVFGYSGAMPQIMKGCGVDYFATQKILWTYNGGEVFPYSHFIWEGIDGSEIKAHIFTDYNARTRPEAVINSWNNRNQKDGVSTRLYPFGYGDGGGGPTRSHIEYLRRLENLEGVPKTQICHPIEFFEDMAEKKSLQRYVGELYFQAHRGTYTSQAKTKKGNRQSEFALREAEFWGAMAQKLTDYNYPNNKVVSLWQRLLLNQFHDILPGSSIERVYEEAEADYQETITKANEITNEALTTLVEKEEGLTIFNSLSWDRKTLVAVPDNFKGVVNSQSEIMPVQEIDGQKMAEVTIPACGWTTLKSAETAETTENTLRVEQNLLENEYLRVTFNNSGEITSIIDKETNREMAQGHCNSFKMYKDVPNKFDAWDIDSMYTDTPVTMDSRAEMEVISTGPLAVSLQIKKKLHNSSLEQEVILRRGSRRVDFKTTIDWQERHRLLKVNFPVNIHTTEAISEIQFGHISRPNHKSNQFDADRFEICNHKWTAITEQNHGFALLNDSKYGINVLDNSVNLTLLKSALAPDMHADLGLQEFTYSFYLWNGDLFNSRVIQEAYDLNTPIFTAPGSAGEQSMLRIDADNIIIETVKPAEDGSGDVVIRLYESMRNTTDCVLTVEIPFKQVVETDMLERKEKEIDFNNQQIKLSFRPFEIKTIRLKN